MSSVRGDLGTHLDRYELDAQIGRGAMGVVHRARDLKLDRVVAIKMISLDGLEPDAESEYKERFSLEARAAGRLSHPGIVTIYDVREEEATASPYLVMEYIEGQTLQTLLNRKHRTLPLSTTLRMAQEIAEALHYAHSQGVVHRDIKPANILVGVDGHPKIADFGVAKLTRADVTLHAEVVGSPSYMAPEQLSGEGGDARSDLFSLGVILYYMLTGHKPFQGNSIDTVCFNVLNHTPPPVSSFQLKCSPELDSIVSRAIAKDPEERYQSGVTLVSDLQRLRAASGFCDAGVGDWTVSGSKLDAIPRYISAAHKLRVPVITLAGEKKLTGQKGRHLSWLLFLSVGLSSALAGVAAWNLNRPNLVPERHTIAPSAPLQPSSAGAAKEKPSEAEPTKSMPKRQTTRPRAKVPVIVVDSPSLAATTVTPAVPTMGILQIDIQHQFANATASIWLDNVLIYSQALKGEKNRRAFVFKTVAGHQFDTVKVSLGKHNLRVRIQSAPDSFDHSKTIVEAFVRNEGTLGIVCDKKHDDLSVTIQ